MNTQNTQMISSICIALVGILLIILSILFFIKEKNLRKIVQVW